MKRLINTRNMDHVTWLEMRRRLGIGGSDAGIVLGVNPYKSILELWLEKTGQVTAASSDDTNYTLWGKKLEPVLRKHFQEVTGLKTEVRNCIFVHKKHEFMVANVDAVVKEEDGSTSLLEIKTATEWRNEAWEKGEIPKQYYAQVQHYLEVLDLNKAYLCCLSGGHHFHIIEIYRDAEYIEELIRKEEQFWKHVQDMTAPEPDGSEATVKYINEEYSKSIKDEIALPEEACSVAEQYLILDETIKNLSSEKDMLANKLKVFMKEHEFGVAGNHRIEWKAVTRTSLDSAKVKEALGTDLDKYLISTSYRKLKVA